MHMSKTTIFLYCLKKSDLNIVMLFKRKILVILLSNFLVETWNFGFMEILMIHSVSACTIYFLDWIHEMSLFNIFFVYYRWKFGTQKNIHFKSYAACSPPTKSWWTSHTNSAFYGLLNLSFVLIMEISLNFKYFY